MAMKLPSFCRIGMAVGRIVIHDRRRLEWLEEKKRTTRPCAIDFVISRWYDTLR